MPPARTMDTAPFRNLDAAQPAPFASPLPEPSVGRSTSVADAISDERRLEALSACDANIISYDPTSFLMVFQLRGRNMPVILAPIAWLSAWGCIWAVILGKFASVRAAVLPLDDLVSPLLTPVSFLLVFRLGRAAVRFWDARAAAGKLVEICRALMSTAAVGCAGHAELREGFARWTCVFPIAAKNFLRPPKRRGWQSEARQRKQRFELGSLLSEAEADEVLSTADGGYAPILVLNRLRQLALRASSETRVDAQIRAALFRQLNEQIDTLTGAWGAMERINATPLPFAYVVHLRTFLILYLLLWYLQALAHHGWGALPTLFAASWALLGIEAASVECERPFRWDANHLKLGGMCVVVARNVAQTLRNTD